MVLAIRKHGETIRDRIHHVRLAFGDSLLVQGPRNAIERLKLKPNFIGTEQVRQEGFATKKISVAISMRSILIVAMLLTELISNNANVILMVPVGVDTAQALGLDPKAITLWITFAASTRPIP